MKKVIFEPILYLSLLYCQTKAAPPNLHSISRIETFAVRTMLRLGDVGKSVNAVAEDAQGLPTCHGRLLWVAHSYASGAGTERSKNKPHQ